MTNLRHGHDALNRDGRPIDDWRSERYCSTADVDKNVLTNSMVYLLS